MVMFKDFLAVLRFFARPVIGASLLLLLYSWGEGYTLSETLNALGFWLGFWVVVAIVAAGYKAFTGSASRS